MLHTLELFLDDLLTQLAKHFIGNEQESYRNPTGGDTEAVSSNIDDKTMHELYLW